MSRQSHSSGNFIDFRKRRSYTLEEKLEIIKELESGVKQAQVAESKRIAASTVQNIWSTRDRVLRDYRRVRNHSLRKIPRNPRTTTTAQSTPKIEFGDIDHALMQWYSRRSKNGGITAPILKAKAQQMSKQFGHYDFKATATWFSNWVSRHGVVLPKPGAGNATTNNGISSVSVKEIANAMGNTVKGNSNNSNNGHVYTNGSNEQEMDEDVGVWPVTVTYGDIDNEEIQEEGDDDDVLDASAFLVQNQIEQESYPVTEVNKPIKEIRNGVEIIYRTRGSRGGRYKSYIWKYFREQEEEVDGGTLRYVECVFCNNRASPKAGRMEKHLQSCEFCPAEILENELGLGGQSDSKLGGRSLQNMISSTMDDMKEEDDDGEIETDVVDDGSMEDDDRGTQSNQDQEASSSSGCPTTSNGPGPGTGLKKRRTFHWKRIATYKNIEEAELALGDLSMWSRKHKHRTQQGIKTYYGCKFGRNCPVQMHLLFEARTKRVIMFQTMEEHCHISKFKKRGLPRSAEKPIRQLYSEGVTKPSHIQQVLDEEGEVDVPPRYQIAYFLDKIRKEDGGSAQTSVQSPPQIKTENSAGETITIPGDLMSNWYDESNDNLNGEEDSGEIEILPFFGGSEGNMDDGSNQNWMTEFPMVTPTSNSSGTMTANQLKSGQGNSSGENGKGRQEFSIYSPGNSLQTSSSGLSAITVTEVHGSASSQFPFRDETTEDGDIIAPGEQNVKKRVINFIEKNFSNRDFLQIHKELQSLKDAHKFTSLIRLASFTSGFLQTAFLDQQHDVK